MHHRVVVVVVVVSVHVIQHTVCHYWWVDEGKAWALRIDVRQIIVVVAVDVVAYRCCTGYQSTVS